MKQVFCIGELLIDFVAENQGSDLSIAREFTKKAGGAPANVACAVSKLGGHSNFIGCVGDDAFGDFLLNVLDAHQVNTSLAQRSDKFTTLAFVSLAEDGERDFVFSRGADKELSYNERVSALFEKQIVHFGAATSFLGGPLEKTYARYLKDSVAAEAFISFDPNYRADLWQGNEAEFVQKCLPYVAVSNICKLSLEEAYLLSGASSLEKATAYLHEEGAKLITITLGAEGTFVSTSKEQFRVPSISIQAVDTTGAGDAFIGCLLYQFAKEQDPVSCLNDKNKLTDLVSLANKAGAVTAQNFGAISSLPSKEDLASI
ncbi:MAG: carbohydrate kinase [Bacteroidia bacterium]|nr:carbohydrate kinase [Bacteroidia bacterium]